MSPDKLKRGRTSWAEEEYRRIHGIPGVSPYRQPSERSNELVACGRRWGATRWAKFWVKRPKLWKACHWTLCWFVIIFIVVPIRIVACPFTREDPFDF